MEESFILLMKDDTIFLKWDMASIWPQTNILPLWAYQASWLASLETAHTYGSCISNMFDLQQAIADKGYTSGDKDHLQYTFVYR